MDQSQRQSVAKFVQETNLDVELAGDILAGTEWKYDKAMQIFNTMLKTNDHRLSFTGPTCMSTPVSSLSNHKPRDDPPPKYPGSLHRGISYANLNTKKGGNVLKLPVSRKEEDGAKVDSHGYYFMLPDLHVLSPDLCQIIKKDLLDLEMMKHLHKSECLNWWSTNDTCAPLYTMTTSGDGNCLLHAASLSIWGVHDRELTLRSALNQVLTDEKFTVKMKKIQRRWKRQQIQVNRELGLEYTAAEWEEEWESVLKLSSIKPRHKRPPDVLAKNPSQDMADEDVTYESLEEIHVFVLAHILLRPIIVVSDKLLRDVNDEPLAPNTFGGIYLPLESPPEKCYRSPIVLAYDASHFCALLPMDSDKKSIPNVIPVTDSVNTILHVQFAVDPGLAWKFDESKNIAAELNAEENLKLLARYLDLIKVPASPSSMSHGKSKVTASDLLSPDFVVGVPLSNRRHPEYEILIKHYIDSARKKCNRSKASPSSSPDTTDCPQSPPTYEHAMQLSSEKYSGINSPRMSPDSNSSSKQGSSNRDFIITGGGKGHGSPTRVRGSANSHAKHQGLNLPVYNNMTSSYHSSRSNAPRSPDANRQPRTDYASPTRNTPPHYNTLGSPRTRGGHSSSNPPRSPDTNRQPMTGYASTTNNTQPHYNTLGSPIMRGGNPSGTHSTDKLPVSPSGKSVSAPRSNRPMYDVSKPCINKDCSFYGTAKTEFYCTKCYIYLS